MKIWVPNIKYKHYKLTSNKSLFTFNMTSNNKLISMDFLEGEWSPKHGFTLGDIKREDLFLSQDSRGSLTGFIGAIDKHVEYETPVRHRNINQHDQNIVINGISAEQIDDIEGINDNSELEDSKVETQDSKVKIEESIKETWDSSDLYHKPTKENTISNESIVSEVEHLNWEAHKVKLAYFDCNTGKYLWSKWYSDINSKEGIILLSDIAIKNIWRWKEMFDFASKHVKDCEEIDLERWKSNLRKDLGVYFEYLDSSMAKLKNQALNELDQIFVHDSLNEIILRKQFISTLQNEINENIDVLNKEVQSENYSWIISNNRIIEHLEKSLLLLTLESKQYQSKIIRRESLLDSLIARIKAMVFKIDDALFSTVFSKVHEVERFKVGNLFSTLELNKSIPQKAEVTPLYWYYKEFLKDKNYAPLQGWLEAISKWEKINDTNRDIFINAAKNYNETPIESLENKWKDDWFEDDKNQMLIKDQYELQQFPPIQKQEWFQKNSEDYKANIQFEESKVDTSFRMNQPIQYMVPQHLPYQYSRPNIETISGEITVPTWENIRRVVRRPDLETLKWVPTSLKVIERRMLQKEIEKRLDPIISSKIKSLQNMNNRKREEKANAKIKGEESDERKYEKSQLTRIHRIMKTIT